MWWAEVQIGNRQIVKERIEDGANEKAALRFPIAACILRRPVATGAFASGHPALAVAGFNQSLSVQS